MATRTARRPRSRKPKIRTDITKPNRKIAAEFTHNNWVRSNQVWHWTIGDEGGEYLFWLHDGHWKALCSYIRTLGNSVARGIIANGSQNRHHYLVHQCILRIEDRRPSLYERAAAMMAPEIAQLVRKPR